MTANQLRILLAVLSTFVALSTRAYGNAELLGSRDDLVAKLQDTTTPYTSLSFKVERYLEHAPRDRAMHQICEARLMQENAPYYALEYLKKFPQRAVFKRKFFAKYANRSTSDFSSFYAALDVLRTLWKNSIHDAGIRARWSAYVQKQGLESHYGVLKHQLTSDLEELVVTQGVRDSDTLGLLKMLAQKSEKARAIYLRVRPEDESVYTAWIAEIEAITYNIFFLQRVKGLMQMIPLPAKFKARIDEIRRNILAGRSNINEGQAYFSAFPSDEAVIPIARTLAAQSWDMFETFTAVFPQEKDAIKDALRDTLRRNKNVGEQLRYLRNNRDDTEMVAAVHAEISDQPEHIPVYFDIFPEHRSTFLPELKTHAIARNKHRTLRELAALDPSDSSIIAAEVKALLLGTDVRAMLSYLQDSTKIHSRDDVAAKTRQLIMARMDISSLNQYLWIFPDQRALLGQLRGRLKKDKNIRLILQFLHSNGGDDEIHELARRIVLRQSIEFESYLRLYPNDVQVQRAYALEKTKRPPSSRKMVVNPDEFLEAIPSLAQTAKLKGASAEGIKLSALKEFFAMLVALPEPLVIRELEVYMAHGETPEIPEIKHVLDYFRKFELSTKAHWDVSPFGQGWARSLTEESFLKPLGWVENSLYWIYLHHDHRALIRLLAALRTGDFGLGNLEPGKKDLLYRILRSLHDNRGFVIEDADLAALERTSWINPEELQAFLQDLNHDQQSFNDRTFAEICMLLLMFNPDDAEIAREAMVLRGVEAAAIFNQIGVSEKHIVAYLDHISTSTDPQVNDQRQGLTFSLILNDLSRKEVIVEGGLLTTVRAWLGRSTGTVKLVGQDRLFEFLRAFPQVSETAQDMMLRELLFRMSEFPKDCVLELDQILGEFSDDDSITYSTFFAAIRNFAAQFKITGTPDWKRTLAPGLEYWQFNSPTITALRADPRTMSLRIVHTDSWGTGKKIRDYLNENPMALGGINGGFWSYRKSDLLSWASRRFLGSNLDRSTFPASIIKTPTGLVNDSKNYWAAIGWAERKDGSFEVHASYLKTRWYLNIGNRHIEVERKEMVPHAKSQLLMIKTGTESHLVLMADGAISWSKNVPSAAELNLDHDVETYSNVFNLKTDDRTLLDMLIPGNSAEISYLFFAPIDNQHDTETTEVDQLWKSMDYIITGDPFLVINGKRNEDATFKDSFLRSLSGSLGYEIDRSALCYTRDHHWLLIMLQKAATEQLSASLEHIGCLHAINLDGGPSAGISLQDGTKSTDYERDVSDALLLFPR